MTKLKYIAVLPILVGTSQATIVNVGNSSQGEATTLPIVDNAGNLLTEEFGQVWVGSFPADKDFSDITTVLDGFRSFGTDVPKPFAANSFAGNGVTTNGGLMNGLPFSEPSGDTADLTDERLPVFVVLQKTGHGGVDEFAVWQSDAVFTPDTDAGQEGSSAAFVRTGNGTLLVGSEVSDVTVNIGGNGPGEITFANGVQLAPIPEPSTTVLAVLAGLGLVARRRR